jgi:protein involved in polysaccharide export with SLBB domain
LYELNENETVKDLLSFAGGFSSNSYKDKLFVNRISSFSRSIVEVVKEDFSEFKLKDGDILNAKEVSDLVTNSVSIQGSVFIPGIYDLSKVSTVGDLISFAKGIMPDCF